MDEFSEKFQTAFDPPPHFWKVILQISWQNCDKSAYVHMEEHLCILWSYFPWDACSTNVQHGNRVKTYPKRPFCITFMLKKPCLKVQILQYKFLDWKWPPPLFGNFSENSSDLEMWGIPKWSNIDENICKGSPLGSLQSSSTIWAPWGYQLHNFNSSWKEEFEEIHNVVGLLKEIHFLLIFE